jgi:hypothetical protein
VEYCYILRFALDFQLEKLYQGVSGLAP